MQIHVLGVLGRIQEVESDMRKIRKKTLLEGGGVGCRWTGKLGEVSITNVDDPFTCDCRELLSLNRINLTFLGV